LIKIHLEAFVYEYTKIMSVLTQLCSSHGWRSCLLSRPYRSNSDIIVTLDHLNLVEEMHIFHMDPTLLNLKICNSTFIRLMLPNQSAKIIKIEVSLSNNVSLTFSLLSLLITSKHLISWNFISVKLNCQPLSWLPFSFWSLVLNLCILTINWQTNFQLLQFDPWFGLFQPLHSRVFFSLVLGFRFL
jgi:hypothetical protein